MKVVIIVNGRPRAGKDSTVNAMSQILYGAGFATDSFSSIDPIRHMLDRAGFDTSAKTPEDRALLAEVGDAVEKHSQFRSQRCIRSTLHFFDITGEKSAAMFLHVREPHIIDRICDQITKAPGQDYRALKVFVTSPREEKQSSNAADSNVADVEYDSVIANISTLDYLAYVCDRVLFTQGVIDQLSLLR